MPLYSTLDTETLRSLLELLNIPDVPSEHSNTDVAKNNTRTNPTVTKPTTTETSNEDNIKNKDIYKTFIPTNFKIPPKFDMDHLMLILWDFDDTLCIHSSRVPMDHATYYRELLSKGIHLWDGCRINDELSVFLGLAHEFEIHQGLISATASPLCAEAKTECVYKHYEVYLDNYCVATNDDKISMMNAISSAYDIPKDRILIIDDSYDVLTKAEANGYYSASPVEIITYISDMANAISVSRDAC